MKIAILGAGKYGSAIAHCLSRNQINKEIVLWNRSSKSTNIASIKKDKVQGSSFKNSNVFESCDIEKVVKNSSVIFLAVASAATKEVVRQCFLINKSAIYVICNKGMLFDEHFFFTDLVKSHDADAKVCVLSGASFAGEMISDVATNVVIASENKKDANAVSCLFQNSNLTTEISDDINGVQILGAIKNIIALSTAFIDRIISKKATSHQNFKALVFTQMIEEASLLLQKLGGKPSTINTSAGIGDIILCSFNQESRNYGLGRGIADIYIEAIPELTKSNFQTEQCLIDLIKKGLESNPSIKNMITSASQQELSEGYRSLEVINKICKKMSISSKWIIFFYNITHAVSDE